MEPVYYKLEVRKSMFSDTESLETVFITPKGICTIEPDGKLYWFSSGFNNQFRDTNSPGNIDITEVKGKELEELVKKLDNPASLFNPTKTEQKFERGDKVVYIPDGNVYDFGYMGPMGDAIIYKEGERNMQDSCAVDLKNLRKIKG
jgi:hypothetical protein